MLVAFVPGSFAGAETLWAAGVNTDAGWYDFNKSPDGSDSELCWAITAANLIAWWQNHQKSSEESNIPQAEAVWNVFRASFQNVGSDPDEAMNWWFSGEYAPQQSPTGLPNAQLLSKETGAYYPGMDWKAFMYRNRVPRVEAADFAQAFVEGFGRGDAFWIGVSFLKPDGRRYTHALTVWGVDYEHAEEGKFRLTALYMSDSDDGKRELHRIPLKEKAGLLLFDCAEHPLYGRIGEIRVNNYTGLRMREAVGE